MIFTIVLVIIILIIIFDGKSEIIKIITITLLSYIYRRIYSPFPIVSISQIISDYNFEL